MAPFEVRTHRTKPVGTIMDLTQSKRISARCRFNPLTPARACAGSEDNPHDHDPSREDEASVHDFRHGSPFVEGVESDMFVISVHPES